MYSWVAPLTVQSSYGSRTTFVLCWHSFASMVLWKTLNGPQDMPHCLVLSAIDNWRSGTWVWTCELAYAGTVSSWSVALFYPDWLCLWILCVIFSLEPVIIQPAAPTVDMKNLLFSTQTDCVLVGDSGGLVSVYQLKNLHGKSSQVTQRQFQPQRYHLKIKKVQKLHEATFHKPFVCMAMQSVRL